MRGCCMNSFDLCVKDLEKSLDKLKNFRDKFKSAISTKTRSLKQQSLQYLQGILLEKGRGNMTNYAKRFFLRKKSSKNYRVKTT